MFVSYIYFWTVDFRVTFYIISRYFPLIEFILENPIFTIESRLKLDFYADFIRLRVLPREEIDVLNFYVAVPWKPRAKRNCVTWIIETIASD